VRVYADEGDGGHDSDPDKSMRFEGTLKSWNDERGFGFIESAPGGQEIFVHIRAFTRRTDRPQVSQRLSFEVEIGPQGKKRAKNVKALSASRPLARQRRDSPAHWSTAAGLAIPLFIALYGVVSLLWRPPLVVAAYYLVISALTFFVYAIDKSAARRGAWRTPEKTLHGLALAGGWPGALIAQQVLHHKSSKATFRTVFWATVVINVFAFVVLVSPLGGLL